MEKPSMSRAFLALAFQICIVLRAQNPQPAAPRLNLIIVEGDGAINNIKQRTSRETIVRVEDENHKPVAGAAVIFLLPDNGPGGVFAGGTKSLSVTTNAGGRAVMPRFQPNQLTGQFDIHVTASSQGRQATAVVSQSNATSRAAPSQHALTVKIIGILGGVAAAGTIGACRLAHCGGWGDSSSLTINSGTAALGAPH